MPIFKGSTQTLQEEKLFDFDSVARPVIAAGGELTGNGFDLAEHQHNKAELIYMVKGVLTCEIAQGLWILAPGSALWIPSETVHSVRASGAIETYCLFVDEGAVLPLPKTCCTLSVSSMLKEMLFRCAELPLAYPVNGPESRLAMALIDELSVAPIEKMHLPMPRNEHLRTIVDSIIARPADRVSVTEWAEAIGMSERTLARLAVKETGMSFGQWRQQIQIALALQWLGQGMSVQKVSEDLGYESASSFVLMFRRALGSSPAKYMAQRVAQSKV
ncbi:MAG: helix-turn-helix transcriptional regulator [Candidatus Obscuribacterales bacterium]|jgi:AraC-like DNA-binding protein